MGQDARYHAALGVKLDTYNDKASLLNVLDFAQKLAALFTELNEAAWVVRTGSDLATACLEKIVNLPGLSIDDLVLYYHKVNSSAVRMATLNTRRATIATISSKGDLLDLARFFKFAVTDTAGTEAYVINIARSGVDDIYQKLLTATPVSQAEIKTYLHEISSDQTVQDVITNWCQRIVAPDATDASLIATAQLLETASGEITSRPKYVLERAQQGLNDINLKLVQSPGPSIDDKMGYFHKIQGVELRRQVFDALTKSIPSLKTKKALVDLRRFFDFAADDSSSYEAWLVSMARSGSDAVSQQLLLGYDLTDDEVAVSFRSVRADQTYVDIVTALIAKIDSAPAGDPTLVRYCRLMEIAVTEAKSHPDWVAGKAKIGIDDVAPRIALAPSATIETRKTYFHKIQGAEQRRVSLDTLAKTTAQLTSKDALSDLRGFFDFAADDSKSFEPWLAQMARADSDAVSQRLLLGFDLTEDELAFSFQEIRTDQIFSDVIVAFIKRVDDAQETDPSLPRYCRLFEIAIAQSKGHADWVTGRAVGGVDNVSVKLALAKASSIETRKTYFHKIKSSEQRKKVLDALTTALDGVTNRAELKQDMAFFNFAADDSSTLEAWLPQIARGGVDKIATLIFAGYNFDMPLDEATSIFHQITSDESRKNILTALHTKVPVAADKAALWNLDQILTAARDDSADRPKWVGEAATAGIDDISIRAITKFVLTDDEARTYFRKIGSDQTSWTILTALGKTMEHNRDSYPILIQVRKYFELASQESGARADWVTTSALTLLDNASARIIKKPTINPDEMIPLFKTLKGDQVRADVINYWRGKIAHAYDDKPSLLALGRFFNAALADTLAHGNAEWVIDAGWASVAEITKKLLVLFPVFEGLYDVESSCQARNCATGFLDTMVIMNTLGNDGLQISFMHAATGTPAFSFGSVVASHGGHTFEGVSDNVSGLSRMHIDYDPDTGLVSGWIENSDRIGRITIRGRQRHSPVDIFDGQAAKIAAENPSFPSQLPSIRAWGTFDAMPATLAVRALTLDNQTVFAATLSMGPGRGFRVNFQRGSYNPKTGMLVLTSVQNSGVCMKLVLATAFDAEGRATLHGISFSNANNAFHELNFKTD